MKRLVELNRDWPIFAAFFVISLSFHVAAIGLIFYMGSGPQTAEALEGNLVDAPGGEKSGLELALKLWKSRMSGKEDSIVSDVVAKVKKVEQYKSPDIEEVWTRDNTGKKLELYAGLVGTDLRGVVLESVGAGEKKLDLRAQLYTDRDSYLTDLTFVSHLVGIATKRSSFSTRTLLLDIHDNTGTLVGEFRLSTSSSRALAAGQKPLPEIMTEGIQAF